VGLLQVGDFADFIVTDDLENFNILQTYINGELVAEMGLSKIQSIQADIINNFNISSKKSEEFSIEAKGDEIQVIKAINGEIITQSFTHKTNIKNGLAIANSEKDILKIAVINRYENEPPALAFINGFNIKNGAIASCVGHDSHNIIAVGTDDDFICKAVNLIIQNKGGISAVSNNQSKVLPLPIAGIMTNEDGYSIAKKYAAIDAFVKDELDTKLTAPFMTLSFMALLVIPSLKLGDKGLFDGDNFEFTALFSD
jgi:adenine deaminase